MRMGRSWRSLRWYAALGTIAVVGCAESATPRPGPALPEPAVSKGTGSAVAPEGMEGAVSSSSRRRSRLPGRNSTPKDDLQYVGLRFAAGVVVRPAAVLATPFGQSLRDACAANRPGESLLDSFGCSRIRALGLSVEDIDLLVALTDHEQLTALGEGHADVARDPSNPAVPDLASVEVQRRERGRLSHPNFIVRALAPLDRARFADLLSTLKERQVKDYQFWEAADGACLAFADDRTLIYARKEILLDALGSRDVYGPLRLALVAAGRHQVVAGADVTAMGPSLSASFPALPALLQAVAAFGEPTSRTTLALDFDGPALATAELVLSDAREANLMRERLQHLHQKFATEQQSLQASEFQSLPEEWRPLGPPAGELLSNVSVELNDTTVRLQIATPEGIARWPQLLAPVAFQAQSARP